MCDDHAFDDMIEHNLRQGGMSRRELGSLTLGAGIAFALPRVAGAADMKERFNAIGIETMTSASIEAFAKFLQSELVRWGKVAKESGARAD